MIFLKNDYSLGAHPTVLQALTDTNMLFPLFTKEKVKELSENVMFEGWPYQSETHAAIRLVTSWGTTEEEVAAFLELI